MSLSMYQACVPVLAHGLNNMSAILDKAVAHCEAKKIDPAVIVGYRLAPNMLPFKAQIFILTDQAKGCAARLAGAEVPSYPDTETTFEELKARVVKTAKFVESFKAAQIDGSEEKDIVLQFGPNKFEFKGQRYLMQFVLPNFYFHSTVAYSILRHCGVELGKKDFLGG